MTFVCPLNRHLHPSHPSSLAYESQFMSFCLTILIFWQLHPFYYCCSTFQTNNKIILILSNDLPPPAFTENTAKKKKKSEIEYSFTIRSNIQLVDQTDLECEQKAQIIIFRRDTLYYVQYFNVSACGRSPPIEYARTANNTITYLNSVRLIARWQWTAYF